MSKNERKFICKKCNFKTLYNSNFRQHLMTAKHKKETDGNNKMGENEIKHVCLCGKKFKTRSGLWKHKNDCSYNVETNHEIVQTTNKDQLIMELLAQNKELISILTNTVPKIGNNNNNTTNNNQFNLQVFLNEDCKDALNFSEFIEKIQISFDDLENQAENGYVKGITKLFIENLQKLGINKRPIHCTDKKRKTLYIKENDTWDKEGSLDSLKNGIQEVTRRTYCELMKSKAENEEEYRDADSEFSCKCLTIQQNLTPAYPRETSIGKVIEKITQNTGIIEK
jgi:hypothetical protein